MILSQLEQLVEIARYGTLSAVSEALHISQPALSRSMQKLEEDLQLALFIRTKNRIELSPLGEQAVTYAQTILSDIETMREGLLAFDRRQRTISIGSCAPAPLWTLLPAVTELFPEATVASEIKSEKYIWEHFLSGDYQLAIMPHAIEDDRFISVSCCKEKLFLSIPPAHPLAGKDGVYIEELDGESVLLLSQIGFWYDLCLQAMPNSHFIVHDKETDHRELLKASALPAFSSDLGMKRESVLINRINIPILDVAANPTFYCVVQKEQHKRFSALLKRVRI